MLKLHYHLLATACLALVGAACLAPGAEAKTCNGMKNCSLGTKPYKFYSADVFGGGSTLIAPYWRQAADCYAEPADLMFKGPTGWVDETLFDYTGTPAQNCATKHIKTKQNIWYIGTGSGFGILGLFSHDAKDLWGAVNNNGPQNFPSLQYAASDAGFSDSTDWTVYDNGTTSGYVQSHTTIYINGDNNTVPCNSTNNGVNNPATPFPNPLYCYGPAIQFPLSVDPVDVAYGGNNGAATYEKMIDTGGKEHDYNFNIQFPTSSGGLRLSQKTLCEIWNGQITNWNHPDLQTDNGGTPLYDPNDPNKGQWSTVGVPLYDVGRADGSGTTSIITRHLAAICPSLVTGNQYTTGSLTLPSSLIGNTYVVSNPNFPGVDVAGKITVVSGSNGVAQYEAFTYVPTANDPNSNCTIASGFTACVVQARVAYEGTDYVLPYVNTSLTNPYGLQGATLQNSSGAWVQPSPTAALDGFSSIQPPQSNASGQYCASCLDWGMRNDPGAWVQSLSPFSPLANPPEANAFPMIGTTNYEGYTCIKSANVQKTLIGILGSVDSTGNNLNTDPVNGILAKSGLAPLPKQWRTAINGTFVKNTDQLNLNIVPAGTAGPCSMSGVVGG